MKVKELLKKNKSVRSVCLGILILFMIGAVFVSGCLSNNNAQTQSPAAESAPKKPVDPQEADLIIKPSEVSDFGQMDYGFRSAPKSSVYSYAALTGGKISDSPYKETLPIGHRNTGQVLIWKDKSGKALHIDIRKFDSDDGLDKFFAGQQAECEKQLKVKNGERTDNIINYECSSFSIGDKSYYTYYSSKNNPDIEIAAVQFVSKNNLVFVQVVDERGKSFKEAVKFAKLVESRLS